MKQIKIWSALVLVILTSFSSVEAIETQGYLTSEEIAMFYQQGYLLKKQCLTPEEIGLLNQKVTTLIERSMKQILQSDDQSISEQEQMLYIDGSRVVFKRYSDQSVSIARVNGVGGMQPALLNVMRSEKMVRTFFELLNTSSLEHLICQLHPKMPGDGIAFPKHRDIQFRKSFDPDWQDVQGNGSYAICIIPIDPMTPANGGLWIDRNNYPEPQGMEEDLIWINAEPGDLLFMHPYLFHGSGPNLSSMSRKTLLTGFCAFGANHKAYPGAEVNIRLTLKEEGNIETSAAPWSNIYSQLEGNH